METFEFRKVRDFGELIHDTIVFIKNVWKPLLKTYFTIAGIFLLANVVISAFLNSKLKGVVAASGRRSVERFRLYGWEYFFSIGVSMINIILVGLITLCFISLYVEKGNEAPTTEEVWSYVKYYFLRYAVASVLMILLLTTGTFFCLVPGIWLWPIVSLILAVMVLDNGTLSYSFNKGFKLIQRNWWTTFGALAIIYILAWGGSMAIVMPVTIINMGNMFINPNPNISISLTILTSLLGALCMCVFILPSVVVSLSYFSLSELKEGTGLMSRINNLGKAQIDTDLPSEEY
ncbi:MAG: hypothetical protein K0S09_2787 [Sphingobacteriaceae bacterium]|jgi:hypothetical protein|nr:hypothetical protein [Sphingobacteriaceae bacterium]